MISYSRIADGIAYYQQHGYTYKEVPWLVPQPAINVTKPDEAKAFYVHNLGCLVASGEQSFIHLMQDGKLLSGRYVCCTPCFRDEPILDELRRSCFLKVELISAFPLSISFEIDMMIKTALNFFRQYVPCDIVKTDIGWDIESKGIELGSYGFRQCGNIRWVYGTGVAEPRLSHVLNMSKEGHDVHQSKNCTG